MGEMNIEVPGSCDKKSYQVYNRYEEPKEALVLDNDLYNAALAVIDSVLRIAKVDGSDSSKMANIKESLILLKTFEEYINKYEHDSEIKKEVVANSNPECIIKHNALVEKFNEKIPKFKDMIDKGKMSEVVHILQEYRDLFFPLVYVDRIENVH